MSSEHDCTTTADCSRRQFLKRSVASGAAVYGAMSMARNVHAAGSDVLKVGLIGCGGRGTGAAANAMNAGEDVRLIAVADIFPERVAVSRKLLRKEHPQQTLVDDDHCFSGFDAYERVIESGIDVAVIACTSHFHSGFLKAAVDAGKHVFVEKPVGIDPAGVKTAMAACEAAKEKGLSVVSGLCNRHQPGIRGVVERVHDGAIGEIVAVQVSRLGGPYVRRSRKPEWSEMQYQFQNWYHFNWLSGSDPVQSVIHQIDMAQWALSEIAPIKAWGLGGRQVCTDPNTDGDEFDHHSMVFEYPNNLQVSVFGRHIPGCYNQCEVILRGTKGRAMLHKGRIEGEQPWRYDGPQANTPDIEHQVLFDSIRGGKAVNEGHFMCRSAMIGVLGARVCWTGQEITWEQITASESSFALPRYGWDVEPPLKLDAEGRYPSPVPGITKLD